MSLNTKQKLAVVAIIGGMITLPIVYAMTDDPLVEKIYNEQKSTPSSIQKPPYQGMIDGTGKSTISASKTGQGSAYNSHDEITQIIASRPSRPSNNVMPSVGQTCEYSQNAIKADVKHYWFKEASRSDLEDIGGGRQLTHEAADALRKLQEAARADGVTLTVGSAFRPVSYQAGIVARKKAAGQSDAQIYKVSSAPGYSEHHTGYALDFSPINNSFASTKAYTWLKQHGKEYGWEQSFTPESVRNTHVAVESWHWKYKGSASAKAALANDACYFQ